jgi:ABC-type nitrate/sulfonate/bicarbonate transport system ATPase subunit
MQVELRNLKLQYGNVAVIRDLSAAIPSGKAVAVVGPSGAGKTSLLRIIAGLAIASHGSALLDGKAADHYYGTSKLSFLFQEACLCPHLTIRQNIELHYRAHRRQPDPKQIDCQLGVVGLTTAAARYPHELSIGMKARAAIARMLCLPPKLLLMDEPFAALDPVRRLELNKEIGMRCRELGATSIWVSHDVVEAIMFADIIIGIDSKGCNRCYDLSGIPPVEDSGLLPEAARHLRDQIVMETMKGGA